ncbi:hypothetical protein [Pseudooctadecabacter sp.]|uniref:hypothetical protein n=1 Tax=Pseudooctadecabacter sp. TaxID=1966338 RepID=UPI003F6CB8E7
MTQRTPSVSLVQVNDASDHSDPELIRPKGAGQNTSPRQVQRALAGPLGGKITVRVRSRSQVGSSSP